MSQDLVLVQSAVVQSVVLDSSNNVIQTVDSTQTVVTGQQGPQGPAGPSAVEVIEVIASTAISGHRVVTLTASGQAAYSSNLIAGDAFKVLGVTLGAASLGSIVQVKPFGTISEPSWNWVVDQPVYLGVDGVLTQTMPTAPSKFIVVIGVASSTTSLFVNVMPPIFI